MFDVSAARAHMIESQIRTSDVTDLAVLAAFRSVAREAFVPKAQMALAYGDAHIKLETNRIMMRPRDFAKMVQAADIQPADIILDVACARGYSTAVLAQLADTVVGLETDEDCVNRATELLVAADVSNAAVVKGELKAGASEHGPFDVIFINGAVSAVPKTWLDQLANGGRLVCLVQNGPMGRVTIFQKTGDVVGERVVFDASAPHLAGFEAQPEFVL